MISTSPIFSDSKYTLNLWININGYMNDDFRSSVMFTAWNHLPHASHDLKQYVLKVFTSYLHVNGFRHKSLIHVPTSKISTQLLPAMQQIPEVMTAIICLWGEAEQETIHRLQVAGEANGLCFQPQWSWQEAMQGFYELDADLILYNLPKSICQDEADVDRLMLAAFWLAPALLELPVKVNDAAPSMSIEPDISVDTSNPEMEIASVSELREVLENLITRWQEIQETGQKISIATTTAVEFGEIDQSQRNAQALYETTQLWKRVDTELGNAISQGASFLTQELIPRVDLDTEYLRAKLQEVTQINISKDKLADRLIDVIEQIVSYDQQRISIITKLQETIERITGLQYNLKPLTTEEDRRSEAPDLHIEEDATLNTLSARIRVLEAYQRHLETRLKQMHEELHEKISLIIQQLREAGLDDSTHITENLTLGEIRPDYLARLPAIQLQNLKQILTTTLDEQNLTRYQDSVEYLIALKENLSTETLVIALEQLAREKHNLEAFLLLMCTSIADPSLASIKMSGLVLDALLNGMEQISGTTASVFSTLNLFAPYMVKGWAPVDSITAAKICMMLMAADYSLVQRLPKGFFWELSITEWPLPHMTNWKQLWEMVMMDETVPSLTSDREAQEKLAQAQMEARKNVQHETGTYLKSRSVKSKRHIQLLNSQIMPYMAERVNRIEQLEMESKRVSADVLPRLIPKMEQEIGTMITAFSHEQLQDLYEQAAQKDAVKDNDAFHRRTCLRIMSDCAESISEYSRALLDLAHLRAVRGHNFTEDMLYAELDGVPELRSIGQQIIHHLNSIENKNALPEWDEWTSYSLRFQWLTTELLGSNNYALRLPHLVSELVNTSIDLSDWLPIVLDDLANPLNIKEATDLLMEKGASHQILHVAQHISVDLQKHAQLLDAEKQRMIETLEDKLLKMGGIADDLRSARELGRWGFVKSELETRLRQYHSIRESEVEESRQRARDVMNEIRRLEDEIFDHGAEIPADVKELVNQGLDIVRRAANDLKVFEEGTEYLREVQYRIKHYSWPLGEVQTSVVRLENRMHSNVTVTDEGRSAAEVLDLLERNELVALGLNDGEMTVSEINTRSDLLRDWLAVHNIQSFYSADMSVREQQTIQSLFRYFSKMVSMRYKRTPSGDPLTFHDPTKYELRELMYPRTSALDTNCILISLPGDPRNHIADLEQLFDHKEWMPDYFVLAFIPGCTLEIRRRLETNYRKQGLVVIDEATLLDMILANANGRRPLGSLRSQMLNAIETQGIDIFKINQLVHPRTAIFVGRDLLVNSIVSTGKNYALYGGRRIGKSSVLAAVKNKLEIKDNTRVILHSFEGDGDCSDNASAARLAQLVSHDFKARSIDDFKIMLQSHMDALPDLSLIFLLDEVDRYITENPKRHLLIEALRTLSERYPGRLRLIVAGFMGLYDCLEGNGPYTPTSDPWQRMFDAVNLGNLAADDAEEIVQEGFSNILGWRFKNRAIPQRVVEYTGGHPAFVQKFCLQLQHRVGLRGDKAIWLEDLKAVFDDTDPNNSFIMYVGKTLELNLDPIGRYTTIWLAKEESDARGFTFDQMSSYASLCKTSISEKAIKRSLDRLAATGVVRLRGGQNYEFSVPDYPKILDRLGDTLLLDQLEREIAHYVAGQHE